jgi:protoporphyrinogen oxidase
LVCDRSDLSRRMADRGELKSSRGSSMRIGIIGGGVTGLTAAYYLQKAGYQTTVFEAGRTPGGLATSFDFGPFHWDKFYHCILTTDRHLLAMIEDLGLTEELRWTATKTGFFSKQGMHSLSTVREFLTFPVLTLWEKFRLGVGILYASRLKNVDDLENQRASDWLTRVFGLSVYQKIWEPLLNSKLGACRDQASASWIWATIFRYYSTRDNSGAKKEMLGYLHGGYRVFFETLVKRLGELGAELRCGAPVERIERAETGVRIRSNGREEEFDRVLFTGPSGYLAQAAPTLEGGFLEKLNSIQYLGLVCLVLLLKRPLSPFYITNLIEKNLFFTGVIEMTSLISTEETAGRHLIYLPRYTVPGDPAFSLEDSVIRRRMIADLRRIHPSLRDEEIQKEFVFRAQIVQPIPVLSYSKLLPDMETSIPGLYLANSSFILNGTLNNNEMIKIASQAVAKITQTGIPRTEKTKIADTASESAISEVGAGSRA